MRKIEEFWFRYFSNETLEDNRYNWLRYVVAIVMIIPMLIGIVLDILNKKWQVPVFIGIGMLVVFSIIWVVIWFYHNYRIKHLPFKCLYRSIQCPYVDSSSASLTKSCIDCENYKR